MYKYFFQLQVKKHGRLKQICMRYEYMRREKNIEIANLCWWEGADFHLVEISALVCCLSVCFFLVLGGDILAGTLELDPLSQLSLSHCIRPFSCQCASEGWRWQQACAIPDHHPSIEQWCRRRGGGGGGGSQRLELVEFFIVLAGDCFSCLLIFTYSVCSLFVYVMFLWPPPVCTLPLPQKICSVDRLLHNPPTSFAYSRACGWFSYQFFQLLLPLFFLSLDYWHVVCLQQPKINAPPLLCMY